MENKEKQKPFSLLFFATTVVLSLGFILVSIWIISPELWRVQIQSSWWTFLIVFLVCHMVNAFAEFFFHRYVLHAPLVPFLKYFYKRHTLHHALTRVVYKSHRGKHGPNSQSWVENKYPILEEEQHEASFFPWYSVLIFSLILSPFLWLAQWLLPTLPILLGGYLALVWSISLYEVLHAIEHWSLEKWQPLIDSRKWGWFWRPLYAFHLRHHADILCNESISGFFGLPIPDWVFGTWVDPETLYEHERYVPKNQFQSPKPRFIGWLDKLADKSKKNPRLNS